MFSTIVHCRGIPSYLPFVLVSEHRSEELLFGTGAAATGACYCEAMTRVLLTGMSGSGKSTLLNELGLRGHFTIDTDYNGWVLPDGTWDEIRMNRLLARHGNVIVSGAVENQGRFYDRFEHVVLLSAPLTVLLRRVKSRTNNPYGNNAAQQAEITSYFETVEPLLRPGASMELDTRRPVMELADTIEGLLG